MEKTSLRENFDEDEEDVGDGFGAGEEREVFLTESRLGMTLENVLEATIVHEVDGSGAARKAGVVAGGLVSGVGDESTSGLLHDEVIDRLRRPGRPLVLRIRKIDPGRLTRRRRESRAAAQAANAGWDGFKSPCCAWFAEARDAPRGSALRVAARALAALRSARFVPDHFFSELIDFNSGNLEEDPDEDLDDLDQARSRSSTVTEEEIRMRLEATEAPDIDDDSFPNAKVPTARATLIHSSVGDTSHHQSPSTHDDDAISTAMGAHLTDTDADDDDDSAAVEQCALRLAALDEILSEHSERGQRAREFILGSDLEALLAKACCECLEYLEPPPAPSNTTRLLSARSTKPGVKIANLSWQHQQQQARIEDEDNLLSSLAAACALECGETSTSAIDSNSHEAPVRWAAAACVVGADPPLTSLAIRSIRLLARLALAQKRRTAPKSAATTVLPAVLRLYRASKPSFSSLSVNSDHPTDSEKKDNNHSSTANEKRSFRRHLPGGTYHRDDATLAAAVACCAVGPACAAAVPRRLRPLIRNALIKIGRESAHAVARAAAARSIGALAAVDPTRREASWLVRACERFCRDALPCVRRAALDAVLALAAALPSSLNIDEKIDLSLVSTTAAQSDKKARGSSMSLSRQEEVHLLHCKLMPLATALAEDSSAEVRAAVARRAGALCAALGEKRSAVVVDDARGLLEDDDARVRCAAARALPAVAAVAFERGKHRGDHDAALSLLAPAATRLASDTEPEARAALAAAVGGFLALLCDDALLDAERQQQALESESTSTRISTNAKGFHRKSNSEEYDVLDRAVFPLALILVNDEEPQVAAAALDGLTALSTDAGMPGWSGATARLRLTLAGRLESKNKAEDEQLIDDDDLGTEDESFYGHQYHHNYYQHDLQQRILEVRRVAGLALLLAPHHVNKLVLSLTDLATSRHWRVRAKAAEVVPVIVPCCRLAGTSDLRPQRTALAVLCRNLASDVVDEVRRAAVRALCRAAVVDADVSFVLRKQLHCEDDLVSPLVSDQGPTRRPWLEAMARPELERLVTSAQHKDRKLALVLATEVLSVLPCLEQHLDEHAPPNDDDEDDDVLDAVHRVALAAALDDQPLVRIGAARLLGILPDRFLADSAAASVDLTNDVDTDVASIAKRSLRTLKVRAARVNHSQQDDLSSLSSLANPHDDDFRDDSTQVDKEQHVHTNANDSPQQYEDHSDLGDDPTSMDDEMYQQPSDARFGQAHLKEETTAILNSASGRLDDKEEERAPLDIRTIEASNSKNEADAEEKLVPATTTDDVETAADAFYTDDKLN